MDYLTADYPEKHFRLWWEYLRRSKKYKDFCEWETEQRENLRGAMPVDPVPTKFLEMMFVYRDNQDVYELNFEQWMSWKIKKLAENDGRHKKEIFTKYKKFVMRDIQVTISNMEKNLNREPSLKEFLDFFYRKGFEPGFYVLNPFDTNPKKVMQEIKNLLDVSSLHRKPGLRYDELEKYLKVYDLIESGKTIHEVILSFDDNYNPLIGDADTQQRNHYRYYEKSKKIIENTEKGFFPGEY